jgi:non-ribosomal peptide synthetase component F
MLAIAEVLVRHRTHQDAACAEFATRWQTLLAALTHDRGGPPPYSAQALASAANNQVVTDAMMAATDALYHAIKALAPIFIDSADPQPRAINAGALDDIVYGSASPPPSSPQPLPLIAPTTGTVATLQRLLRRGGTALLVGPTGVGKTYAVKQAVLAEGARLVIVKGRPDLDDRQLYGGIYPTADLVFPSEVGTPVSSSNAWRSLQRLLVRVGLPRMRFHDLRHSCATFLALQGVHMRTAMEILGHSTIATTAEIYMSVLDESKQHAAAQMGALFPHKDTA